MIIQVNGNNVADNISHGFQVEKEDYIEITLFSYDGLKTVITVSKTAELTVITGENETGDIEIRKTTEQQLKDLQEENTFLKDILYELSSEVYK